MCAADLSCTVNDMIDYLSRFAFPGQDPSKPVLDKDVSLVLDPRYNLPVGWVKTSISADGLTITNRTLPAHVLYDGEVVRAAKKTQMVPGESPREEPATMFW